MRRLIVSCLLSLMLALPTLAQTAATPPPATAANPARGPVKPAKPPRPSLETALAEVRWDSTQRGALIVVDPKNVFPIPPPRPVPTQQADGSVAVVANSTPEQAQMFEGNTAEAIGSRHRRKLRPCGTVSVLAPLQMTVLNTKLGKPDVTDENPQFSGTIQQFAASLTAAQWQQISDPQGLGRENLTRPQQAFFDRFIPNPARVIQATNRYESRVTADKQRILTDAERNAIRLHVVLKSSPQAKYTRGNFAFPLDDSFFGGSKELKWYLKTTSEWDKAHEGTTYGAKFIERVPNTTKPGDVDTEAITRLVPLAPPEDGKPLTVKTLVQRIGKVNGVEIFADRRVGQLPVWVRGEQAQSGDLLRALCLAVCGTVRKVDTSVYVLTFDRTGLATQTSLIGQWTKDARQGDTVSGKELKKRRVVANPWQYLSLDPKDPIKPSATLIERIATHDGRGAGGDGIPVGVNDLGAEAYQHVRGLADKLNKQFGQEFVDGGQLSLSVVQQLNVIIPNVGESEYSTIGTLAGSQFKPADEPLPVAKQTLFFAPRTVDEAKLATQEAERQGAASVFLLTDLTDTGQKIIAAALENAKIPVYAAVRLLRASSFGADAKPEWRDISALGEPGDWLAPGLTEVRDMLVTRLTALAKMPNLGGIIWLNSLPPGYRSTLSGFQGDDFIGFVSTSEPALGYRLPVRLQFLRDKGADPIDIPTYVTGDVTVPFFATGSFRGDSLSNDWAKWRNDKAVALLKELRAAIEAARPGLPLLLHGEPEIRFAAAENDDYAYTYTWFADWQGDVMPRLYTWRLNSRDGFVKQVRGKSKRLLVSVHTPGEWAYRRHETGDGLVIDLTDKSVADALRDLTPAGATGNLPR